MIWDPFGVCTSRHKEAGRLLGETAGRTAAGLPAAQPSGLISDPTPLLQ